MAPETQTSELILRGIRIPPSEQPRIINSLKEEMRKDSSSITKIELDQLPSNHNQKIVVFLEYSADLFLFKRD